MSGRTGYRHARRWARALATLSIGAAAAVGATACAPITTDLPYSPSDGARAVLGNEVTVQNLLILTAAEGDPALVVGGITNRSTEDTAVTLTFGEGDGSSTSTVNVPASDTVLLNPAKPDGETLILDVTPARPGASVPVTVATPASGSTAIQVTVLDGTLEPYDQWLEFIDGAGS